MDGDTALKRLQQAEVQTLSLDDVHIHEALQPRSVRVLRNSQRNAAEQRSAGNVANLRCTLRASKRAQLDPVLVAWIDGKHFIVDGHHRVRAYRAENRPTIPARVVRMDLAAAVLASKLVNLTGRAMPMEKAQCIEAAWQHLAGLTDGGNKPLPAGVTFEMLEARLGVGHSTLHRMMQRLTRIIPSEWKKEDCDPGTGFPTWTAARSMVWNWKDDGMTYEQALQHRAARLAATLAKQLEEQPPDVRELAFKILARDARQLADEVEAFRELEAAGEPDPFGSDGEDSDF